MSRLDYSKWDRIEISDDEDDTHPNVDTPSLFKWRHEARVQRMEQDKKEKDDFMANYSGHQRKLIEMKQKLKEAEEKKMTEDLNKLKLEVADLEKQEAEFKKKEEDLKRKERLAPQNIDTLCKDGKSKTIINKVSKPVQENLTDEERFERQKKFQKENEKLIKKFGMFKRYEDSEAFLLEHPKLACEETANYLVLWCINLECEEKHDLMNHVAHQTIVMQFILELAKSLETHPQACIRGFFSRIKLAEKQYMDAFADELNSFKERVKARAKARIDEAIAEVEEEERQKRLGPGGLDPVEVFESLPPELQACFESKDLSKLQEVLMAMPKGEAEHHLKRCIDSGMWIPNAQEAEGASGESANSQEEVYEKVD